MELDLLDRILEQKRDVTLKKKKKRNVSKGWTLINNINISSLILINVLAYEDLKNKRN